MSRVRTMQKLRRAIVKSRPLIIMYTNCRQRGINNLKKNMELTAARIAQNGSTENFKRGVNRVLIFHISLLQPEPYQTFAKRSSSPPPSIQLKGV